jgi:GTP-binding protein LepA
VGELLQRVVKEIPAPQTTRATRATRALVFDSFYDSYKGVVALVRIFDGAVNDNDKLYLLASKTTFEPVEIGYLAPSMVKKKILNTGDVGYIATGLKDISLVAVGDTVTMFPRVRIRPLPGYQTPKPMVFLSLYPADSSCYKDLAQAFEKLKLTDGALSIAPEHSASLGAGFKVGFLGLLHSEITIERLKREYSLSLISTTPSVVYEIVLKKGKTLQTSSPGEFPNPSEIKEIREPKVAAKIYFPSKYLGNISKLVVSSRGEFSKTQYLGEKNLVVEAKLPLSELITNFYDGLKSASSGYASLDYEAPWFEKADLVKLDILIHGEPVEPFSRIVPRGKAHKTGKAIISKLKEVLPREQFKVAIQAAIGGKIIARETLPALRKDVTAKLYGGDRTRRDKLLKKQAKGKKRLGQFGKVTLPPEAVRDMLRS